MTRSLGRALTQDLVDRFSQRAYDIISSPRSRKAFDVSKESPGIASLSEDQLRPAPDIGQDSYEVLLEAGLKRDAIDDLVKADVVRAARGGKA